MALTPLLPCIQQNRNIRARELRRIAMEGKVAARAAKQFWQAQQSRQAKQSRQAMAKSRQAKRN